MGKTFKDKNKNRRYSEFEFDDYGRGNSKSTKQDAKRFRQDRSSKRCVRDEPDEREE